MMKIHQKWLQLVVFISVLTLKTLCKDFMPESEWVCGATPMDTALGFQQTNLTCYDVGTQVNQCCVVHDECYVNNGNQKECDEPFCACLVRIGAFSKSGAKCRNTLETFCLVVQLFGGIAHADSRKKINAENSTEIGEITPSTTTTTTTTTSPSTTHFDKTQCFDQSRMEHCIVAFEYCNSNGNQPLSLCEEEMCQCTRESLNSSNPECYDNIEKTCRDPMQYKQIKRSATLGYLFKEVNYFGYSMTILTAIIATIFGVGFIVIIISVVYRYMTRRSLPISPSRTPLCTAASSDLTLGYFQNSSNNVLIEEERKLNAQYP